MASPDDDDVELAAGLDDDALDELQELLWHGYVPERYRRSETEERNIHLAQINRLHARKRQPEPPQAPQRQEYVRFRCEGCGRRMWSPIDDETAEKEYRATFGEAATDDRLTLCERCFDEAMKGFH
jgi:hypothetical protein